MVIGEIGFLCQPFSKRLEVQKFIRRLGAFPFLFGNNNQRMQPGVVAMVIMFEQIRIGLQHDAVGHQAVEHLVKSKPMICDFMFYLCRAMHNLRISGTCLEYKLIFQVDTKGF